MIPSNHSLLALGHFVDASAGGGLSRWDGVLGTGALADVSSERGPSDRYESFALCSGTGGIIAMFAGRDGSLEVCSRTGFIAIFPER